MNPLKEIGSPSPDRKYDSDNREESCCDSPKFNQENGFIVCLNCGCIHSRIFDDSPRRAFTQEEINKRKTTERVYSPIGPRTVIRGSKDARGSLLSPKYKSKFNRLGKIHRSLTTSYERNLWIALPNLQRLQRKLKIPDHIAEDVLRIYTRTVKEKLTMGRSIDALLTASIFAALRSHAVPRTIEEIAKAAQIDKKKILKSYRLIVREIFPQLNLKIKRLTPERYVDKFNDLLKLSMQCRNKAVLLIKNVRKNGLHFSGKDPKGIAAAALYLSSKICNEARTQKDIADLAKVTEVTLRTRVKDFQKYCSML